MLSDVFQRDYRQMTAQGVTFTPEDIVRLNALAVKVKMSADAARTVALPRLVFLPKDSIWRAPLVLREPTVAHDLWLEMCERYFDTSKDEVFLFLHAFALSRHPGRLPDPTKPRKVVRAVRSFAAKRLATFTRAQLQGAVEYALFGADWTVGESADKVGGESRSTSPTIGLLTECRILRLPITLDDAKRMTASELEEARMNALKADGRFDIDAARNRAFGEYVRARNEIRARAKTGSDTADRGLEQ